MEASDLVVIISSSIVFSISYMFGNPNATKEGKKRRKPWAECELRVRIDPTRVRAILGRNQSG
jgi:hypothetical protein